MSVLHVRLTKTGAITTYRCNGEDCTNVAADPLPGEWTQHWERDPRGGGLTEIHLCGDACRLQHFPAAKSA